MTPTEYLAGEARAAEALSHIENDTAVPNEVFLTLARLETDAARLGFCRALQKHIERARAV